MACSLPAFTTLLTLLILPGLIARAQNRAVAQETVPEKFLTQERAVIAQATHIFEGEILQATYYFTPDSTRLYRTAIVQCKRLLKGALPFGTAQIVYKGPAVAGFSKAPQTGERLLILPVDDGHGNTNTQGLTLPEHQPILFFCRLLPTDFKPLPPPPAAKASSQLLEVMGVAYDAFRDYSIISDVGGRFADFPALYQYLNATYNLSGR